ncbi:MAG: hypothetical protein IT427_09690 [Pirellulales bacterium]|nr:hypothetical protein [Pirellulales bacterium]
MIAAKNFEPDNAGSWFWMDVLLPVILLSSIAAYWRQQRRTTSLADR